MQITSTNSLVHCLTVTSRLSKTFLHTLQVSLCIMALVLWLVLVLCACVPLHACVSLIVLWLVLASHACVPVAFFAIEDAPRTIALQREASVALLQFWPSRQLLRCMFCHCSQLQHLSKL